MRTWIAAVLLAACARGPAPKTAPTAPVASGASCDQMASHLVGIMPATDDGALGKKIAAILQERCTQDAWTTQARQCMVDARELHDADGCKQYLTKAQVDATDKEMDAQLGAPGGGPAEAEAPPAVQPPPPPPATRAPAKKKQAPKAGKSGDPCEGGE